MTDEDLLTLTPREVRELLARMANERDQACRQVARLRAAFLGDSIN